MKSKVKVQKEIFKTILNYPNYKVSNLGNVKSLRRKGILEDKLLKLSIDSNGYYKVSLLVNGKQSNIRVHLLVAYEFLNHKPNGLKTVVDHIDNNPLNNNVKNLQIITNRANCSKDKAGCISKYTGVVWHKKNKKWQSQIKINNKTKYLGSFIDEYKAHLSYQKALLNLSVV